MSSNPESQTTFDPNTPADKYYFSAFFNEALRNSAAIIGHTTQLIDVKYPRNKKGGSRDEDALHDAGILKIKGKKDFQRAFDIRAVLSRRFTLLEAFKEEKITRQVCFLQLSLKLAKEYRNYYSHWHHNPITLAGVLPKGDHFELSDFTTCLKKCFTEAVKESKRRFEFSDDIEALFTTGGEKGKKITERYALFDADEKTLSDSGIHFLLCLLLPKDRANLYLSRIRGYKGRNAQEKTARQIFTLRCLKLPKSQLVSEESAAALTLDLMAYLARCPIPLYNVLQADREKLFTTRESADELAPPTEMKRNLERAYYFLARFIDTHRDFGAGFRVQLGKWRIADYKNGSVARHIEQKVYKFDRLGEIRKEDAAEIAAREANLKTRLPKILTSKEADREWVQYAPHYARHPHAFSINSEMVKGTPKIIIDNGKVKNHPADQIIQQAPDFVLPNRALPLIAMLLLLNEEHTYKDFQIKNLLNDYRKSVKNFLDEIQAEASNGKTFDFEELKDKAQAHCLKMSWLPRKLIKVLTDAQKSFPDQIQHKLDAEIERTAEYETFLDCMKKIRGTGKEPDERSKYKSEIDRLKGKYKYKSGAIAADFLRDIWRFTARDNDNMPNASEYQSLQKKLAIYAVHRYELDEDFKGLCFHQRNPFYSALIKGDQKGHFFAKYREIPDAYQAYLKEKKQQLERVKEALKADPEKWPDYYDGLLFALKLPVKKNKAGQLVYNDLHDRANLTAYLKNLKKALRINGNKRKNDEKTTALGVPPGFFVDCFIRFCEKYKPDLKDGLRCLEPVKLIERYLEKEGEGAQGFYGLERAYTYEKQPGKSIAIKGTADAIHRQVRERMQSAKDAEKKLKEATDREAAIGQIQEIGSQKKKLKEIIHREAEIRYAQATDRVLWLCAKKWLAQHFDLKETERKPKLSDYAAGYDEVGGNNLLDQTYPFEIQHLQDGHTFKIAVKAKLRDIGKVHALLRDKRLPTLLELLAYPVDQKIDNGKSNKTFKLKYAELEKELKNYEKCRMESLKCIQKFEEKHAPDRKEGYVPFGKTLEEKAGSMAYIIRSALRNSWMHNEYPWWKDEGKTAKLFYMDKDLKSAYLRYCGGPLDGDKDNHITLHGIEKSSPACFWYEQTQRFFKVE